MATASKVKPTHKAVKSYTAALATYADQSARHEGTLRSAFQNLLAEVDAAITTPVPQANVKCYNTRFERADCFGADWPLTTNRVRSIRVVPYGNVSGVAQLVEQGIHKPWVAGSSPAAAIHISACQNWR